MLAEGGKEGGKVAEFWGEIISVAGWEWRLEGQVEVVVAGEAGLVDDGASVLLQLLPEVPAEIVHGNAAADDVCGAAVDGDGEVLWGGVGFHLETGRVEGERIDRAFPGDDMELEAEAINKEVLVHGVEIVEGVDLIRAGLYVEP